MNYERANIASTGRPSASLGHAITQPALPAVEQLGVTVDEMLSQAQLIEDNLSSFFYRVNGSGSAQKEAATPSPVPNGSLEKALYAAAHLQKKLNLLGDLTSKLSAIA